MLTIIELANSQRRGIG